MTVPAAQKAISIDSLKAFAANLLVAGGYAADYAAQTAELLVWANARGIDSHGVMRIPRYLEMVQLGQLKGRAEPRFVSSFGATSVLDADLAPGAVGMNLAVNNAVELARKLGIAWCAARNITHAGAVGYFAEKVAAAGQIGIVMTASKPLMSYFGAKAEGVSTNPVAICAPNPAGRPLLLDMSTSAAALGKIMAAKEAGKSIPVGWGVEASGADTTDPAAVKFLLPMAGAKGSGLSLMIEVLSSVLVGNPLIARALAGDGKGAFNGLVIALNIAAFGDAAAFANDMADLAKAIKALPKADGTEEILLPGERGYQAASEAQTKGVQLEAATARKLCQLAVALGVAVPASLQ